MSEVSVGPHKFRRLSLLHGDDCEHCYEPKHRHPTRGYVTARPMRFQRPRLWPFAALAAAIAVGLVLWLAADDGDAHLVRTKPPATLSLKARFAQQSENLYHARYVCRNGGGEHRRWACAAAHGWLWREWQQTRDLLQPARPWWVRKQIAVAEKLGAAGDREGTDPWPNCPDPYDHRGASWTDTLACENRAYFERYGNTPRAWLDSPGMYRCGLQFDPSWEDVYGRLCP